MSHYGLGVWLPKGKTGYIDPICLRQEPGGTPKLVPHPTFFKTREACGDNALRIYHNAKTKELECELPKPGTPVPLYFMETVSSAKVVMIDQDGNRLEQLPLGVYPAL